MRSALLHRAGDVDAGRPRPAAPEPVVHPLSGHSGARVVLHSQGTDSFVRKTAADHTANVRLQAQAEKQRAFWMHGLPFPKVRSQSFDAAGIASFDMNYIPGRTIADAVINGGTFDPAAISRAVERLVWIFKTGTGPMLMPDLFESKIQDIAQRAVLTVTDPALLQDVHGCGHLLAQHDWTGIPETPCHGDLTLENILLTAGKSVAFIDCDEIFASSYWLDFGKLFQDIDGHWCIRALYAAEGTPVRLLGAIQKLEQLGLRLRSLAADCDTALPNRLPQLAALCLFRAIPYARTETLISFLCHRIQRVLKA